MTIADGARRRALMLAGLLVATTALPAAAAEPLADPATALHDYVAAPDPAYGYRLVDSSSDDGYTAHLLRMTSQRWRTPDEARPTAWRHWLVVIVPDRIRGGTGTLVIAGSSAGDRPSFDEEEIEFGAQLAVLSRTVVAVLMQAPYQPVSFPDASEPLEEDALVAYSWDKAIATGDYSWPAYLPMVKAAVRAMDTVEDFVPGAAGTTVDRFVVIGASKRGAATWLTAAVDERVEAIAPLVFDALNLPPQLAHHLAVYGDYAPAIHDYVDYNLPQRIGTPEGAALTQVVDPYAYRALLDMPKYIVGATGDQFFLPDAAQFYFDDLPGEKLLRNVPDSDHSLSNSQATLIDALSGLFGWYLAIVEGKPRPVITWQQDGNEVVVRSSKRPLAARLWRVRNPNARDFRLETIGEAWKVSEVAPVSRGEYAVRVKTPPVGWKAWFVELAYPSPHPALCQVYSTQVFVTPDTLPYEDAEPPMATAAAPAAALGTSGLLNGIFDEVGEEVHENVLDQVDDDLGERALRYCFARKLDDLDEAVELYARLGLGQSPDAALEQELEDLWRDLRGDGKDVIDDATDRVGDFAGDVKDKVDDLF